MIEQKDLSARSKCMFKEENQPRIGILCEHFIEWGGGVDFIRIVLYGLTVYSQNQGKDRKIYLLVPKKTAWTKVFDLVKTAAKTAIGLFSDRQFGKKKNIDYDHFILSFRRLNEGVVAVRYSQKTLQRISTQLRLDVILPCFAPVPTNFQIPWIGYLYDFQHQHLRSFFTDEEFEQRHNAFSKMIKEAGTIIVNAKQVKADAIRFHNIERPDKIFSLPFCPVLDSAFFEQANDDIISKYQLEREFFIISNQFWKHKDHITAIKAFRLFLDRIGKSNVSLVCTGQTLDHRFPGYFAEVTALISSLSLEKNVIILGFIPKRDQLHLIKASIAVVQPTLFEGGPGGGAVYESVAYGIRSIVSDIMVNKEIEDPSVTFFSAGSSQDLASKMEQVYFAPYRPPTAELLYDKSRERANSLGSALYLAIKHSISKTNPTT
jgi:glycosyltransferase involved in cell wall biosynthesis